MPRDRGDYFQNLLMSELMSSFALMFFFFDSMTKFVTLHVGLIAFQMATRSVLFLEEYYALEYGLKTGWALLDTLPYLFALRALMCWFGQIYVKTEVLAVGNEQLLNNLKEGVIILDSKNDHVRFVNEVARQFNIKANYEAFSMTFADQQINFGKPCFA